MKTNMKWFVAYLDDGEVMIKQFSSREAMLRSVEFMKKAGIEILCTWTEV